MGYSMNLSHIHMFYDNTSAIKIAENPVQHSKTKHIDVRYHFIREHVENGSVELHFVLTDKQIADLLTKALNESTFTNMVGELGMLNFTS